MDALRDNSRKDIRGCRGGRIGNALTPEGKQCTWWFEIISSIWKWQIPYGLVSAAGWTRGLQLLSVVLKHLHHTASIQDFQSFPLVNVYTLPGSTQVCPMSETSHGPCGNYQKHKSHKSHKHLKQRVAVPAAETWNPLCWNKKWENAEYIAFGEAVIMCILWQQPDFVCASTVFV